MSADRATYLDSSALVKLVIIEAETPALMAHLAGRDPLVSSALAQVEVIRGVRRSDPEQIPAARRALDEIDLIELDNAQLRAAADLEPDELRSLDAAHVAAAHSLGDGLRELVTYDRRMTGAAKGLGLAVAAPA